MCIWATDAAEESFEVRGGGDDQDHFGVCGGAVLERVRYAAGGEYACAGFGDNAVVVDPESYFAFENPEDFIFALVDVEWWTGLGDHGVFGEREAVAGVSRCEFGDGLIAASDGQHMAFSGSDKFGDEVFEGVHGGLLVNQVMKVNGSEFVGEMKLQFARPFHGRNVERTCYQMLRIWQPSHAHFMGRSREIPNINSRLIVGARCEL